MEGRQAWLEDDNRHGNSIGYAACEAEPVRFSSLQEAVPQEVSHNRRIGKRVLIGNGEVDGLTGFSRAQFPPGEVAFAHSHADMTEVFLVESGEGRMQVDQALLELVAGTCITVEPGETHEIRNTGEAPLVLLYFGIRHPRLPVLWPAVISYAGDDELEYITSQSGWEAIGAGGFTADDRLIDTDGTVYTLQCLCNNRVVPQAVGTVSLEELVELVRTHAATSGSCCVAKFAASSIDEAIAFVDSDVSTLKGD